MIEGEKKGDHPLHMKDLDPETGTEKSDMKMKAKNFMMKDLVPVLEITKDGYRDLERDNNRRDRPRDFHNGRSGHLSEEFMANRRSQREEICERGAVEVWGKSPTRSELDSADDKDMNSQDSSSEKKSKKSKKHKKESKKKKKKEKKSKKSK